MNVFDNRVKKEIEEEIRLEFKEALVGIKMLPNSAKFGVYLAFKYYLCLFNKIANTPAENILVKRIRVPNTEKFTVMMRSYVRYKIAML